LIYIAEAHAKDKWPIGIKTGPQVIATKTTQERQVNAADFLHRSEWQIETYIDTMEDEMISKMAAWPLRYWIVHEGTFKLIGVPKYASFDLQEIDEFFKKQLLE